MGSDSHEESKGHVIDDQKQAAADGLSEEHRNYLLQRHGTLDIDPLPSMNDSDPYNWPKGKKHINLMLVAFHALMSTFSAAAIQSAFVNIAMDLDVSVQRATYLTSLFIAILGGAPVFWRPLSNVYGRRPIFLLSLICSLVGNIGCANSHSYGTMALCRAITAFFISPAAAIGSAVVSETFFKKERATYMGVWTIFVTLGVPIAPFLFGFLALRVNYRWIYYVLAITNGVQFILYFFFGPETLYMRNGEANRSGSTIKNMYFNFRRIDPRPLTFWDFAHPFVYAMRPRVWIPAMGYAMIFLWSGIMPTILIPQIFPPKFNFNTQQVGLQFLSVILGTVIGEQVGGRMSDWWMWRRHRKLDTSPPYEFRLWLGYIGHALSIVGVVVFLVQTGALTDTWNITPLVGVTICSVGNQIVTTIMITYAVDCYRDDAAAVGVFITFVRQIWGFIGPFWFPNLIAAVGYGATAGIATAMMVVFSIFPTVLLQFFGHDWP
ncbi:MFS multidrug transporter [Mycena sanguinolenta]|uniref:MFS multidrug transporter n=1 Tax=Mycena sanguinolenta TaxID=230812 RepID=A0A8H6XQF8_9AGAR|nr:MFS multidrug transporter [Mycena sanguinolenta]